jgi:hypothetical protein
MATIAASATTLETATAAINDVEALFELGDFNTVSLGVVNIFVVVEVGTGLGPPGFAGSRKYQMVISNCPIVFQRYLRKFLHPL